jgi:hypothetical protein
LLSTPREHTAEESRPETGIGDEQPDESRIRRQEVVHRLRYALAWDHKLCRSALLGFERRRAAHRAYEGAEATEASEKDFAKGHRVARHVVAASRGSHDGVLGGNSTIELLVR